MADTGTVGEISAPTLKGMFDRGEAVALLDVREDHERQHARIAPPGGVPDLHIPLGEVAARVDEIEDAARGVPLVVVCHHGQRSMVAATWLAKRGISDVRNLDGGSDAWSIR